MIYSLNDTKDSKIFSRKDECQNTLFPRIKLIFFCIVQCNKIHFVVTISKHKNYNKMHSFDALILCVGLFLCCIFQGDNSFILFYFLNWISNNNQSYHSNHILISFLLASISSQIKVKNCLCFLKSIKVLTVNLLKRRLIYVKLNLKNTFAWESLKKY